MSTPGSSIFQAPMQKSVYDTDQNNIVDDAESAAGLDVGGANEVLASALQFAEAMDQGVAQADNPIFTDLIIGVAGVGVDYKITFDGENNDGIITFNEGSNRFEIDSTVEIVNTSPEFRLKNSTAEDIDGGRESILRFRGIQSGAEETTLAMIRAQHEGAVDDEKGELIFYTNDGSDGEIPTERLKIDSGGRAVFTGTVRIERDPPRFQLDNTTVEDTDGGRDSSIRFRGSSTSNGLETLAQIDGSHDGAADDAKGQLQISTYNSVGDVMTLAMTINSSQTVIFENDISDGTDQVSIADIKSAIERPFIVDIQAGAMVLDGTNPPEEESDYGTNVDKFMYWFDKTTEEIVYFQFRLPGDFDPSQNVVIEVKGQAKTADNNEAQWSLRHEAVATGEDFDDDAYTQLKSGDFVTNVTQDATDTALWAAVTGTTLGWAAGDMIYIKLSRVAIDDGTLVNGDYGLQHFHFEGVRL